MIIKNKLLDVRRYFVYRFVMYKDGFSHLQNKDSMDVSK